MAVSLNSLAYSTPDSAQTEDDILESLDCGRFTHPYVAPDNTESSEDYWNETWKFKTKSRITKKGKQIVRADPNVGKDSLKRLMMSEEQYLSTGKGLKLTSRTKQEIYRDEFLSNNETGLAHLAQCIRDNPEQCKADLISTYSEDRNIPFIIGALYLDALLENDSLYSFELKSNLGYVRVQWEPTVFYTNMRLTKPPRKKMHTLKYYDPPIKEYHIPDCPVCGNPAKMCRTGLKNRLWQVCCTDPEGKCENFLRNCQFSREYAALQEWCSYCDQKKQPSPGRKTRRSKKACFQNTLT